MTEFNPSSFIGGMAPSAPQSRYVLPSFTERTSYGVKEMNPYNKLFEERIIFVGVQIDDVSANDLMAQLITLEQLDCRKGGTPGVVTTVLCKGLLVSHVRGIVSELSAGSGVRKDMGEALAKFENYVCFDAACTGGNTKGYDVAMAVVGADPYDAFSQT